MNAEEMEKVILSHSETIDRLLKRLEKLEKHLDEMHRDVRLLAGVMRLKEDLNATNSDYFT